MALPALLRKLFKSSGYGSELNDGIVSRIISNQDWSNSYDYPVGVVARGSDGDLYYSVAQSGPGTSAGAKNPAQGGNSGFWKSFGSGDSIPTGTVLWLSTTAVPAGYLLCNGAAVGRAAYPELFAAIGTTYGAGDGSTTFNLPNLIGRFAEGSTAAGTAKAAGLPNITGHDKIAWYGVHEGVVNNDLASNARSGCFNVARVNGTGAYGAGAGPGGTSTVPRGVAFDASKSNPIYGNSNTVQPPALTLLPCIKAFASVVGDATVVAGQLVNDIQSKVALDGSNVSSIGAALSEYMAHAAMPVDATKAVDLSVPAIGGMTAAMTCDGWLRLHLRCSNNNTATGQLVVQQHWMSSSSMVNVQSWETNVFVPVPKGFIVQVYYTDNSYDRQLTFFPCFGSI